MLVSLMLLLPTGLDGPATAQEAVTAEAVDAFVTRYQERTGLPGAAVAVTHGDRVVRAAGYGRTATGDPLTADTPMAVASVSKSFTATAVLRLVERGEVDLDQPVRRYLPEFAMADARAAGITVRQLLNQTSGMADSAFHEKSLPQPATLQGAVARLRTARLASAPGAAYSYHNTNFQVAARLVEVVSGEPFADFLHAEVFAPLGMRHSTTIDTDRDLPGSARGHLYVLGRPIPLPEPAGFGNGSGGVLSTAHDMARWLIAQNTGDGVLSAAGVEVSRTPSPQNPEYALGWTLGKTPRGAATVEHEGDLFTSTAYQLVIPASGYGIAVMANTGMAFEDADTLMAGLVALVEGDSPVLPGVSPLLVTDLLFLLAALVTVVLGVRGVVRARRWTARWWVLPLYLAPVALCLLAAPVFRVLARGSDIAWIQVVYLYPTFMTALVTAAAAGTAVVIARLAAPRWAGRLSDARQRRPANPPE
ncbi:serine hydrolase domain-containing protein [Nonomuraea monospora]|uniref:Serine hydrolase domain-containing protein n=2 Tax=Nonomuraea monospora TaxID=568818 RepID=A0ABN3CBA3_9ACTN